MEDRKIIWENGKPVGLTLEKYKDRYLQGLADCIVARMGVRPGGELSSIMPVLTRAVIVAAEKTNDWANERAKRHLPDPNQVVEMTFRDIKRLSRCDYDVTAMNELVGMEESRMVSDKRKH